MRSNCNNQAHTRGRKKHTFKKGAKRRNHGPVFAAFGRYAPSPRYRRGKRCQILYDCTFRLLQLCHYAIGASDYSRQGGRLQQNLHADSAGTRRFLRTYRKNRMVENRPCGTAFKSRRRRTKRRFKSGSAGRKARLSPPNHDRKRKQNNRT